MRHRLRRQLLYVDLRRRRLRSGGRLRGIARKARRATCFFHIRGHLRWMGCWGVLVWRGRRCVLERGLGLVEGRLGYVGSISIHNGLGSRGAAGLGYVRRASKIVSRRGTRPHLRRLGSVTSRDKGHSVDGGRGRRGVMS
jgi:hypothetical protein